MPFLKPFAALAALALFGALSLLLVAEDTIAGLPEGVVAEAGGPAMLTLLRDGADAGQDVTTKA